jgi:hypothetical protein
MDQGETQELIAKVIILGHQKIVNRGSKAALAGKRITINRLGHQRL